MFHYAIYYYMISGERHLTTDTEREKLPSDKIFDKSVIRLKETEFLKLSANQGFATDKVEKIIVHGPFENSIDMSEFLKKLEF